MSLRKHFVKSLAVASLLVVSAAIPPAVAETIASKIESQGEMTYLKVTNLRQAQRNGLINIQAEVTNEYEGQQTMYYRFRWLDASGFSVWDEEPWKPMLFHGKDKQLIQVVAPTSQATDFRLILQSPANKTTPASD